MSKPDLNTASFEQLSQVPKVGKTVANRIIDSREQDGPFHSFADLQERVRGLGTEKREAIRKKFSIKINVKSTGASSFNCYSDLSSLALRPPNVTLVSPYNHSKTFYTPGNAAYHSASDIYIQEHKIQSQHAYFLKHNRDWKESSQDEKGIIDKAAHLPTTSKDLILSKIDLNSSTSKQLATLLQIPLVLAEKIISCRNKREGFKSFDDLKAIRELDEKTIEIIEIYTYIKKIKKEPKNEFEDCKDAAAFVDDLKFQTVQAYPYKNPQKKDLSKKTKDTLNKNLPSTSTTKTGISDKFNLNTAKREDLDKLEGISSELAERIVRNRKEYGPFESFDDLKEIHNVGSKSLKILQDHTYLKTSRQGFEFEKNEEDIAQVGREFPNILEKVMVSDKVCRYISKEDFKRLNVDWKKLFLLHVNINSLSNKEKIIEFISPFKHKHKPDVICVSDSRKPKLDASISEYRIFQIKPKSAAGGVTIYLEAGLKCRERKDLYFNIVDCENIWVEVYWKKRSYVFGAVYRHGGNVMKEYLKEFETVIKKLNKENSIFYMMGDINFNMLKKTIKLEKVVKQVREYSEMLWNLGVKLLINKATRLEKTRSSSTLIDHIYTNDTISRDLETGIVETLDVSDHYPVYCIV